MYDKALIKKTRQFLTTLMKIYQIYRIKNGVSILLIQRRGCLSNRRLYGFG